MAFVGACLGDSELYLPGLALGVCVTGISVVVGH